jgi:HAD superfamily, subfamily IIIB (Acid phosphatase)
MPSGSPSAQPADAPLAVFDLDGTLADTRHRLHHLEGARRDWPAFFAAASGDEPLAQGVALARTAEADGHEIAYVTGRPERCRKDTVEWLARHGLPAGRLLMRAAADRRPARTAKPELLRELAAGRTVAMVVDDDEQVCAAYEAAGFRVVRAGWMAASAALERAQEEQGRT